jgi:hypothetical protein
MGPLLALSLVVGAQSSTGTLVDRVVAVIDKQVITLSELLAEARIALAYKEGEQVASADLDEELLQHLRDYVVNQTIIAMQARRLGAAEVPESEVSREVQRFTGRFHSNDAFRAFLRRFDISEETLRNLTYRNLRNDRYVAERMRLRVAARYAEPSSPQYQEAFKRWLAELRESAEVRLLGPTGELELQPHGAAEALGEPP